MDMAIFEKIKVQMWVVDKIWNGRRKQKSRIYSNKDSSNMEYEPFDRSHANIYWWKLQKTTIDVKRN